MWKNGRTAISVSSSVMGRHRLSIPSIWAMLATRLRCVSMTPFEPPVVPLEYGSATRSLAESISGTSSSSGASVSAENGVVPGAASNVKISSIPPASCAASRALSRK